MPLDGCGLARGPLAGPRDGPLRAGRCCPSAGRGYEAPPPGKSGTVQLQRAAHPTRMALISRGRGGGSGPSTAGRDRGRPPRLARAAWGPFAARPRPPPRPPVDGPPVPQRASRGRPRAAACRTGAGQRLPGRATLETELPQRRRLTPFGRPYGVAYGHRPAPTLSARKGSRGPHVVTDRTDEPGTCGEAMARPPDSRSLPGVREGWPLRPDESRPTRGPWPTTPRWPARTR
jgi:hypothetical protein